MMLLQNFFFSRNQPKGRSKRKILKEIFILLAYIFLLNSSLFLYREGISYPTLYIFLKNKQKVVITFGSCILSMVASTNVLLFLSKMRWLSKVFLFLVQIVYLLLIFFMDQDFSGHDEDFAYGYYSSRGVIGVYFLLLFLSIIVVFPSYLLWKYQGRIARNLVITLFLLLGVILLVFFFQYLGRESTYRKGMFGETLDIAETDCRVDDDTHLWSHYLPKFFIQLILLTYWCKKSPSFVSVIKTSYGSPTSIIEVECPLQQELVIKKIPNVLLFSYDEKRAKEGNDYISVLSESVHQRMVVEKIPSSSRTSNIFRYTYDSDRYETIYVECGEKLRNSLTQPKRIRVQNRKPPIVNFPLESDEVSRKTSSPNILILLLDSLSRKSFERGLSQTFHTIENEIIIPKKMEIFQFFNYKSVGPNTKANSLGLLNGVDLPNQKPIFEGAKKKGYVTVLADNYCNEWSGLYNHPNGKLGGLNEDTVYSCDYIHLEPSCDGSYTPQTRDYSPWIGSSSSARKCLFQKEAHEYVLDYGKQILEIFPDTPKWMYMGIIDGHESSGESINYVDPTLSKFFKFLSNEKPEVLKRSVIIVSSDHGNHFNFFANTFKQGMVEGYNPGLYFLFPEGYLLEKQKEILRKNQHRVVVPFDVHKTMCDILGLADELCDKQNEVGIGLFEEEIPRDRSCEDATIPEQYCDLICL